jgi:hypothetical protein
MADGARKKPGAMTQRVREGESRTDDKIPEGFLPESQLPVTIIRTVNRVLHPQAICG